MSDEDVIRALRTLRLHGEDWVAMPRHSLMLFRAQLVQALMHGFGTQFLPEILDDMVRASDERLGVSRG